MSFPLGTQLGNYKIIALIGAGGMGEVYKAHDARLRRDVAIKVLPESFAEDKERLRRFEQEARALAALNHPNVLSIHDVGSHACSPFLVMELLEGETLRDRLQRGALPLKEAVPLALQMVRGLAAAHEKGLVHRDLKPANLFLTQDGVLKILDFGLAKQRPVTMGTATTLDASDAGTMEGALLGTVGYMSPEQIQGFPVEARSDLFSLGVVLWEMVTGENPFHRASPLLTMHAILLEELPELDPAHRVPGALEAILRACLAKAPADRFHSAHDLAFALGNLALASEASGRPGLPVPARHRRGWVAAMAMVVLLGAAAAASWSLRGGAGGPPSYRQITFQSGKVDSARFSPDGRTIVYSAAWEGRPAEVFAVGSDGLNPHALGSTGARVCGVSTKGEVAVLEHVDLWSGGTLDLLPMDGGAPREMMEKVLDADLAPDGSALAVVHEAAGHKRVLEFPIGHVIAETFGYFFSPRISPDGRRVAVFESHNPDSLLVLVDRAGRKEVLLSGLKANSIPDFACGLCWSPTGDSIWLSGCLGDEVQKRTYAVGAGGRVRLLLQDPSLPRLLDVNRDGDALFLRDLHRNVARIKGAGDKEERSFAWLDGIWVIDLSADGTHLVFTENEEEVQRPSEVFLLDLRGGPPKRLGPGLASNLSADGAWVYALGARGTGVLYPTGPGQPIPLAMPEPVGFQWPGIRLPGGNQVLVRARIVGQKSQIHLLDLGTWKHRVVADYPGITSRDGTRFAYLDPVAGLQVRNLADGTLTPLVRPPDMLDLLCWSRDGASLYYWPRGQGWLSGAFTRYDLATGRCTLWRRFDFRTYPGGDSPRGVAIAPEADAYAFSFRLQLASDLFLVKGLK